MTYTNGNIQIEVSEYQGRFQVRTNVYDGTKWQTGTHKSYKSLKMATKQAEKRVTAWSDGWTANPTWTVEQA